MIYFALVNGEEGRNEKRRVVIPTNLNGTYSSPPKVKTVSLSLGVPSALVASFASWPAKSHEKLISCLHVI